MNPKHQNNDQETKDRIAFVRWIETQLEQRTCELNAVPQEAKESPWGKQHQFEIGFLSRSLARLKSETPDP